MFSRGMGGILSSVWSLQPIKDWMIPTNDLDIGWSLRVTSPGMIPSNTKTLGSTRFIQNSTLSPHTTRIRVIPTSNLKSGWSLLATWIPGDPNNRRRVQLPLPDPLHSSFSARLQSKKLKSATKKIEQFAETSEFLLKISSHWDTVIWCEWFSPGKGYII